MDAEEIQKKLKGFNAQSEISTLIELDKLNPKEHEFDNKIQNKAYIKVNSRIIVDQHIDNKIMTKILDDFHPGIVAYINYVLEHNKNPQHFNSVLSWFVYEAERRQFGYMNLIKQHIDPKPDDRVSDKQMKQTVARIEEILLKDKYIIVLNQGEYYFVKDDYVIKEKYSDTKSTPLWKVGEVSDFVNEAIFGHSPSIVERSKLDFDLKLSRMNMWKRMNTKFFTRTELYKAINDCNFTNVLQYPEKYIERMKMEKQKELFFRG